MKDAENIDNINGNKRTTSGDKKSKESENPHKHHRQRLKQRFLNEGLSTFDKHQILELLLFYAIPQQDTNELAHRLIDHFGSLSEVLNASFDKLIEVKGIKDNSAILLSMMPHLFRAYTDDLINIERISGRNEIENYIYNTLCSETYEKVLLLCLDNRFSIIKSETIGEGSVSFSSIDKRRVIELCLRHNATSAIIAHNHPRGLAIPSAADLRTTMDLRRALSIIDVNLIDHVIVATDDYISVAKSDKFGDIFL